MTKTHQTKILIVGSGPAGATAAIYAARANLQPIMVRGMQPGGQLTITTDVENYPGFAETIQGPWLVEQMEQQAIKVGATVIADHIISCNLESRPFVLAGDSGDKYIADAVIISTGAEAKWLGLDSEKKFQGFGVSGCATCDGFFYKNKTVMVIGGGNTAVEEALFLSKIATKVILMHRGKTLRAEKILQDRLFKKTNIEIIWEHKLIEILGSDKPLSVERAIIENTTTGVSQEIKIDGIFIAIGHKPNSDLFKSLVNIDNEGYIITQNNSTKTNIPGVFAAGDVQDKIFRQAVTAAATGCMAALEAEKFLSEE